jgi:hypothetical protein
MYSPRCSVQLSMEVGYLPTTAGWFLLNHKGGLICDHEGDGGQEGIGGALQGSVVEAPRTPAPSFFVSCGCNHFIVACRTMDQILNEFTVGCSSPSFHRDRGCHFCSLTLPLPPWP